MSNENKYEIKEKGRNLHHDLNYERLQNELKDKTLWNYSLEAWRLIDIDSFVSFANENNIQLDNEAVYGVYFPTSKQYNDILIEQFGTKGIYLVFVNAENALLDPSLMQNQYDDYLVITKIDDNSMILQHKNSIVHLTK